MLVCVYIIHSIEINLRSMKVKCQVYHSPNFVGEKRKRTNKINGYVILLDSIK